MALASQPHVSLMERAAQNDARCRCHPESGDGKAGSWAVQARAHNSGREWSFRLRRTEMLALDLEGTVWSSCVVFLRAG